MGNALDLTSFLSTVLNASIAALDEIPGFAGGLEGAPQRAFLTAGQPALDCCNQLTVNAATTREANLEPGGIAAGQRHRWNVRRNHVGVNVWITRCLSDRDAIPSIAEMEAVAEQVNADGWALWNYLFRQAELVALCDGLFMDALTPLQPSGGCFGWVLSFRAELAGYENGATT